MKKEIIAIIVSGLLLFAVGFTVIVIWGSSYTLCINTGDTACNADEYTVTIDQKKSIIDVSEKYVQSGSLFLKIHSVAAGKAYIDIIGPNEYVYTDTVYVHSFGVITINEFFGKSSATSVIPILVSVYTVIILICVIIRYRRGMRRSLYQYSNVRNLGWILFIAVALAFQIPYIFTENSIADSVNSVLNSAAGIAYVAFPIAFIVSVLVAVSNIRLMKKEGRNWKNMLGLILGLLVCIGTIFPPVLSEFLQRTTIVDVHYERGFALYAEMAATNIILVIVSYLECVLCASVILSVKAAKKNPAFDKDYILILGCQIKNDGTLTPLLKGRADRAMEFAKMQKEKTGKSIVFVPCGGKGDDEIIPEANAIKQYLVNSGIPDSEIITEDRSKNTYENFENAINLIREKNEILNPKIAFSTTNYHVFRSGVIADGLGVYAEGTGSKTRSYFWINAFIREFIAALYTERKKHARVIAVLVLLMLMMVFLVWISNVL
jgi:uncharacterized SAM-binding protein YcdF (DUF218 family)